MYMHMYVYTVLYMYMRSYRSLCIRVACGASPLFELNSRHVANEGHGEFFTAGGTKFGCLNDRQGTSAMRWHKYRQCNPSQLQRKHLPY